MGAESDLAILNKSDVIENAVWNFDLHGDLLYATSVCLCDFAYMSSSRTNYFKVKISG